MATKMRLVKIDCWWFIVHTARMKYFWFKYFDEDQARDTMKTLQESWDRNAFEEEKDMVANFNLGYRDSLPADRIEKGVAR